MTTTSWIILILNILILIYLWSNYKKKKRLIKLKEYLINHWGKPKTDKYFNFFSIKQYFENNSHKNKAFHLITNSTVNDLDLEEVFKFIDRTSSKIGQQFLYYKLRTIPKKEQLNSFSLLTELFKYDSKLRLKTQLQLSKLNTHSNYDFEVLVNNKPLEKPTYYKYVYALSIAALIFSVLSFFKPVFILPIILIFAINTVIHFKNKQNVTYYNAAINQFVKSLKVGTNLAKEQKITTHFKDTSFLTVLKKIKLKTEFISFDNKMNDPIASILWFFIELIKIQFNLGTLLFYSFINSITNEKENLDKLFQFIGKIDSAIAIASVKSDELATCKPQFVTEKLLSAKEIIHPLIKNCISNSLELNRKSLLLTGSNMSGKTTFIRNIALNTIFAQSFNFAFAKEFTLPFLKLYSSIKITDELINDTSYYLKEVLTIKELIKASNSSTPSLFVLDEIFKGTNTVERISGGKAILSYLNNENNFVLVSTHDIELTDLLKEQQFDLHHFTETIQDDKLHFDHKLKHGKLKTRNAIKILELHNYPKEIIEAARKVEKDVFL